MTSTTKNESSSGGLPIFSQASFFRDVKNVSRHSHPATELILVQSGTCEVHLPEEIWLAEAGSLLVIAPEVEHNQINHGMVETLFTVFSAPPDLFDPTTRVIEVKNDPWIGRFMQLICDLSRATHYELCAGVILSLLQSITRVESERSGSGNLHPAISAAVAYVEKHYADMLTIDEVARQARVGKSHLKNLFIRQMGYSPLQFIQNCRMSHARQLLLNSYLAVSDIATACGYEDANYFSRAFRKVHQCTPSQYRVIVRTRPEAGADFIRL